MKRLLWIKDHIVPLFYLGIASAWAVTLKLANDHGAALADQRHELANARAAATQAQQLAEADQRVRAIERAMAMKIKAIEDQYQEDLSDALVARDRTIADLRAGNRRLFVNVVPSASGAGSTGTGAGNQETRAQLSTADGEFLIRFAAEADAVVLDLNRCVDRSTVETSMQLQ